MKSNPQQRLLTDLARDLSTRTADEIRAKWSEVEREAIDAIARSTGQPGFDETLKDHNPVYYILQKVFFANDPSLLYAPLHRDILCKALLSWALQDLPAPEYCAGLNILVQRESYKTTIDHGAFPLFLSLRAKYVEGRDIRILLGHHKEQQASLNLQKLNGMAVQSAWMKAVWSEPPWCFTSHQEFGTKLAFDWPCKNPNVFAEPNILAAGMGSRLTGFHFDWILLSDPVTPDHADSKIIRDDTLAAFEALRYTLDSKTGKLVVDGTRYHPFDLHHHNLEAKQDSRPLYRNIVIPAITDKECLKEFLAGTIDENRTDGLSFPSRHSYRFLRNRRDLEMGRPGGSDRMWWLQMMNEVRSEGRIVAKPDWFQRIPMKDVGFNGYRVITIDPAFKGSHNWGEGDDAAIEVWNLERRGAFIFRTLLDGISSNELSSKDGEEEIFRLMVLYGIIDVAPEERGGFTFSTGLKHAAASRGLPINIIKLKSQQTGFDQRVGLMFKEAESGRVAIAKECNHGLATKFLDQVANYQGPDSLPHDDAIDAGGYAFDPAIAENYAPRFNRRGGNLPPWLMEKKQDEPHLTRYQGR